MFDKLFRNYNQNRKTIWTVIIFIAFFVILLQVIFGLIRSTRQAEQEREYKEYIQKQNSIKNNNVAENKVNIGGSNVTSDDIKITSNSSYEEIITYFVKLCNEKKIEQAYNVISKDCKSILFPTIDDFKNNYYNKIFKESKTVKIEKSMYDGEIYKVTYNGNLLTSGGNLSGAIQDYVYITEENNEKKLSFNKFLYCQEINKTSEDKGVVIRVLQKKTFIDREEYQIQISNNTNNKIYITQNEQKTYLLDENEMKYSSNMDELQSGTTLIESNKSSVIELSFNKTYSLRKNSTAIVFSEIITNYQVENQEETISINIKL